MLAGNGRRLMIARLGVLSAVAAVLLCVECGGGDGPDPDNLLTASEGERQALRLSRTIRNGMTVAEVTESLGAPTYDVRSLPDGSGEELRNVVDPTSPIRGSSGEMQAKFGCQTFGNRRGAGYRMLRFDLQSTVFVCVYFDQNERVEQVARLWH